MPRRRKANPRGPWADAKGLDFSKVEVVRPEGFEPPQTQIRSLVLYPG